MRAKKDPLGPLHYRPLPGGGAAGLAAVLVLVNWITWVEFNESIVYPCPWLSPP
jgi:hypothetical protein